MCSSRSNDGVRLLLRRDLCPANGRAHRLPAEGQGYGKKLLGKNHSRIEGPCILYAPDTEYDYLFLSVGGLDYTGGHNSALYDAATGRCFLIFHTRFSALGDDHRVRAHQFWFNGDGWPVVSPLRYAGAFERPPPTTEALADEWRRLRHELDINTLQHRSQPAMLAADGSITGGLMGAWSAQDASVTLDETVYQGTFKRGYDWEQRAWVDVLTTLSPDGGALWGIRTQASLHD